jgi:KTSC domain
MARQNYPVASEAIARLEYDDAANEAYVTFHKGGSYVIPMPQIEVERWASASSVGGYFNTNVKGRY